MGTHRCPTAAPRDPRYPPGTPGSIQLPPILPHDDTAPHVLPHGPMAGAGSRGWGVTPLSLTCPSCPTRVRAVGPPLHPTYLGLNGVGTRGPRARDTRALRNGHGATCSWHRASGSQGPRARDTRDSCEGHGATYTPCKGPEDMDSLCKGHACPTQRTRATYTLCEGHRHPCARDLGTYSPRARDTPVPCEARGATHIPCEGPGDTQSLCTGHVQGTWGHAPPVRGPRAQGPLVQGTRVPGAGLTLAADGPPVRGHGAVAREAVPLLQADALVAARLLRARCAGACGRPRHGETPAPPAPPTPTCPGALQHPREPLCTLVNIPCTLVNPSSTLTNSLSVLVNPPCTLVIPPCTLVNIPCTL